MRVLMLDLPFACFWIELDDERRVVKAPPIAAWMHGKHEVTVRDYVAHKGGSIIAEEEM